MNEIKRYAAFPGDVRVRETADGTPSRTITGYAIVFNTPSLPMWKDEKSEAREVISPEAVTMDFLNKQDIKFTMFHDRALILARSKNGKGSLMYDVDDKGVSFEFDAPATADGDKALELVKRGDLCGCSFAFTCQYDDPECVTVKREKQGGRTITTCTVRRMLGIHDFTLAADPAYPATTASLRDIVEAEPTPTVNDGWRAQVAEMRKNSLHKL